MLYGHQRGERLGAGHRLRHRRPHWFGQLAGRVSEQESEPNAFQKGISRVSMLLIRFMLVMAPVVLLINGYTKGDWWEAALFALSVAVGLTPEMLPMIVTSTLARGAVKLSKQKVIVKHLDAIQNFGAMDILCTDKTGTLTQIRLCWRTIPTSPARSASGYCMPPAQQPLPDRPEKPARHRGAGGR